VRSGLEESISFKDFQTPTKLPTAPLVIVDPVNGENNVAALYSAAQRNAIVAAAHEALDAVQEAQYATTKGRAVEGWQVLLGPLFRP
jgi:tRNA nucleotidyltransferase (CCA-adding enzyme)